MNKSIVKYSNGKTRTVKNLGWLLRNWKIVNNIYIYACDTRDGSDCLMRVELKGMIYETFWADRTVCRDWLRRPTFKGRPLYWFGKWETC